MIWNILARLCNLSRPYQYSDSRSIIQMHPLKRFQEGQKGFWRNDVDGQDQLREKKAMNLRNEDEDDGMEVHVADLRLIPEQWMKRC